MPLTKARAYPTIAELSQPMLRLAGPRINPKTNGPFRASGLAGTGHLLDHVEEDRRRRRAGGDLPPQARVSNMKFSPDGSRLAFLQTKDAGIELWIADTATGSRQGRGHRHGSHQRHGRRSLRLAAATT